MLVLWLLAILVLFFTLAGVFFGAPYLPTLNKQIVTALDLAELKSGQTLIELGCGDGRVLIAAAKRGVKSIGYELNPILVLVSIIRTRKYRSNVKVIWGNYWQKTWPQADTVFVFLIGRYMSKLNSYLTEYAHKPIKLVSFAFKIPNKKVNKEADGIYLYLYR